MNCNSLKFISKEPGKIDYILITRTFYSNEKASFHIQPQIQKS